MDDTLTDHVPGEGHDVHFEWLRRLASLPDREGRGLLWEIMEKVQEPDFQRFLFNPAVALRTEAIEKDRLWRQAVLRR